jgi:hypothetical protein
MFACCRGPVPIEDGTTNSVNRPGDDADELISAPSLVMINNKINASSMIKRTDTSPMDDLLNSVAKSVQSGTISVTSSIKNGSISAGSTIQDMQNFLSSLVTTSSKTVHAPTAPSPEHSASSAALTFQTETSDASESDAKGGIPHIEYKKYALKGYVKIPSVVQPFLVNNKFFIFLAENLNMNFIYIFCFLDCRMLLSSTTTSSALSLPWLHLSALLAIVTVSQRLSALQHLS